MMGTGRAIATATTILLMQISASVAMAQDVPPERTGTAVILGQLVADDTGMPAVSATVELWSAMDSLRVASTLTNAEGRFRFARLRGDEYYLRLSSLGYGTVSTQRFELAEAEIRDVGVLRLSSEAVQLDPIEVSTERTAVTFEADRTSYNLGVMPGTEGTSVTETLQTIPELEVDIDGRITLHGSTPAIYINGRPAPMSGEALAIFLEQFPADYLQKIEVMDNPSARYDARGSGGVVNLVMKEGVELGMSGNVFANAGTRGQYGVGGRGTLQRGDWTATGGGFLRLSDVERESYDLRQNLIAAPPYLRQDSWTDRSGLSSNGDVQLRYEPTERTRLFARGRLSGSGNHSKGLTTTTHLDDDESPFLVYDRASDSDSRNLSVDFATGLDYTWEPRRHELEVELEFQTGRQRGDSRREITMESEFEDHDARMPAELTLEEEGEDGREASLNVDYTRPLGERGRIEFGFQTELEESDRDRLIHLIDDPSSPGELTDRGFDQREISNAIYSTVQRQFGEFGVQLGLRAEHLALEFEIPSGEAFRRQYTNFFPSANVSYRFDRGKQIRLSYSRRVGMPAANVLNPTDLSTDPLNRRVGNPDVQPQFTHSLSLNASWSGSAGSLRLSPYYRRTTNDWAAITTVDEAGVSTRTYENLASQSNYGATLTWSMRQRGGWGGNISLTGRRNIRDASNLGARYSGSSMRWSSRANVNAQVTGGLSAQGNFSYSPPTDLPQGRSDASYRSDFGLRYRLLENRASIRLSLQDPFGLRRSSTRTQDITYVQIGRSQDTTRSAQLNVSWSFGGGGRMRGGAPRGR
jgi:outer membrane cobalamin receptor